MFRPRKRRQSPRHQHALFVLIAASSVHAVLNITLDSSASQIIYSPPACGLTLSSAGTDDCSSSWRVVTSPNASDGTLVTTSGQNDASGGFIPQLFISVRALALSIQTSPASTAIVNVSASTANPVVSVSSRFNSSIQPILIIGLVEDRLTTVALTFDPSPIPSVLQIDSIIITISDNNTAPFVAPPVPPSTVLPTVTPTISPSPTPQSDGQTRGDIAAEVLGSVLGAALVAAGACLVLWFHRKRRRRASTPPDATIPPQL